MEISAANAVQHKIFCRKPSFVEKKMDEKRRFGNNKKATKFGMRLFNGIYQFPFKVVIFQIRPSIFYAFMNIA